MLNWDGGSSSGDGLAEKNGRETEQEDGRCLTIMKTLEMGAIIFPFSHKISHLSAPKASWRQRTNIWDVCHWKWPKCQKLSLPQLLHTSVNHIQMSQGSWQHMEQCLGSEVFSLVFSHTIPSAVDPCWTFPMGCSLGHILSKAERAADSQDQERCQERCISHNSTLHAGIFYTCLISLVFNLLLCAISEKSQEVRKKFPNHVEVRNLEWARWKKNFSDLLWTVGQIRVCKR